MGPAIVAYCNLKHTGPDEATLDPTGRWSLLRIARLSGPRSGNEPFCPANKWGSQSIYNSSFPDRGGPVTAHSASVEIRGVTKPVRVTGSQRGPYPWYMYDHESPRARSVCV